MNRDILAVMLGSDYEILEAENGLEAIEILQQGMTDIDLILLDIMMPQMDGLELCKQLRARSPRLGIIMLTARTQEMDKVTGLLVGADDYVTKPFSPSELMARVDAIYRRVEMSKESSGAKETTKLSRITYRQALIVGAWQVLALIPGTSRSGSTIIGGLLCGMSRACASQFTFFLAIPVMAGASGLKLVKFLAGGGVFTVGEIGALLVGCIVAFVVSILAIRFLMDYVKKHTFTAFGWYRIALGIVVLGVWALQTFVLA